MVSPPLNSNRSLSGFVTTVFTAWNGAGIVFLVLRNYEQLPEEVSNDLDILLSRHDLARAERSLIAAAHEAGYQLHNRAEFAPVSLFFQQPETSQQIQVDLFGSLEWRGLDILPAGEVLERRTQRGTFSVPHPMDEAVLNLLTRLLYSGYVKEKYRPAILTAFKESPEAARTTLEGPFGIEHAASLVDRVEKQQWSTIESMASRLRRKLLRRTLRRAPLRFLRSALRDARRLLLRWLKPPGLSVVLLGPDGCGKSTVAPKVIDRLRHSFSPDKGLQIHWKPVVFMSRRRAARPPTTEPHGRPPRGPVASLLFLAYHWLEYFLGAFTQIHRVRFRNGLVMIDRHYYDFLVDPRRYRLSAPVWAVRLGGALLPKPDLVFLLDAPTEVLQSRKQEVSIAETERQRNAFLALVRSLKNGHVMDASRPPEEVASAVVQRVLEHLAARTASRGGCK